MYLIKLQLNNVMKKVTICTDIRRKILHRQKRKRIAVKKCKKKRRKEVVLWDFRWTSAFRY